MARRKDDKYTTAKYKKEGAKKLVNLCVESMSPNVIADVTSRPRPVDQISVCWNLEEDRAIVYKNSGNMDSEIGREFQADGDIHDVMSEKGRKFWTSAGLLGRIRGWMAVPAFASGSIVDRMGLFMTSEVTISFIDLRKVFRYIFGVNDAELYASLKELIKQRVISIASAHDEDNFIAGPFILQADGCGLESLMNRCDPGWNGHFGHGTWYPLLMMPELRIDGLLMRMFLYCLDDLDNHWNAKPDEIVPFKALYDYFVEKTGDYHTCEDYIRELMQIQTRELKFEEYQLTDGDKRADKLMFGMVLDETIEREEKRILAAAEMCNQPEKYIYVSFDRDNALVCNETADDADIRQAVSLLNDKMNALKKDSKTSKVVNAEKILFVIEEIPKVFSLKTLYEIFKIFDTDEEVVRRDVRALCRKNLIVSAGRGLYCSKKYADSHFNRIGNVSDVYKDEPLGNNLMNGLLKRLDGAIDLLNKELCSIDKKT